MWASLEREFVLHLAQARANAAPHGRKSDFADAERLLRRFVAGDLRLSYVPDEEQRGWRVLARNRVQITRQRVRLRNQIEALLEEGQIKLSTVVSDLLGISARRILQALAAGVTDTTALMSLAGEHLHATDEQLAEALNGQLQDDHRLLLRCIWTRLNCSTARSVNWHSDSACAYSRISRRSRDCARFRASVSILRSRC